MPSISELEFNCLFYASAICGPGYGRVFPEPRTHQRFDILRALRIIQHNQLVFSTDEALASLHGIESVRGKIALPGFITQEINRS